MLGRAEFGSGLIVSTAGSESPNLYKNLDLHPKQVHLLRVQDFEESRVDWNQFSIDREGAEHGSIQRRLELCRHRSTHSGDVMAAAEWS